MGAWAETAISCENCPVCKGGEARMAAAVQVGLLGIRGWHRGAWPGDREDGGAEPSRGQM